MGDCNLDHCYSDPDRGPSDDAAMKQALAALLVLASPVGASFKKRIVTEREMKEGSARECRAFLSPISPA
jgi:hypothetical protein